MNQLDLAIHSTVHDCEMGTQELADQMGMSRQILLNKANFNTENAYFSPPQLMQLQNITGNYSINHAMQAMNKSKPVIGKTITHSLLSLTDDIGKIAHEFNESMLDGVLTEREKAECLRHAEKTMSSVEGLIYAIHNHETGKIRAV